MQSLNQGMMLLLVASLTACSSNPPQAPQIARISPEELEKVMPKPVPNLSLDEIVAMSKQGMTPEAVIEKIKTSQSSYTLTPTQALDLSKQGVDAIVLDFMHAQHEQLVRDSVADEINKREIANQKEQEKLKRLNNRNFNPYYDPFIHPYWGWGFGPAWRNRFYFGSGFW